MVVIRDLGGSKENGDSFVSGEGVMVLELGFLDLFWFDFFLRILGNLGEFEF